MMERLQKIISTAGIASRRKAEELIQQGLVSVNGVVVTELGSKADATRDQIRVAGRRLESPGPRLTILFHKPVGCVSTLSDPQGRPTVASLLRKAGVKARVYPVGRLDYYSSGLILLTNDGDLANTLMARSTGVPRTYHVKLEKDLDPGDIRKLETGLVLDGRKTEPADVRLLGSLSKREKPWYEMTLVEGRYHQVRRMFERIGKQVIKLKRVRFAFLKLEGLNPGEWRQLELREVQRLKAYGKIPDSRNAPSLGQPRPTLRRRQAH